jgi:predicted DCC family thiol-disulfide oxidoreductase YuxK
MNNPIMRVTTPPSKPILIWDGDCRFCALWVERWRSLTSRNIEDAPFQEAAARFPEIPKEQFDRAIVYVDEAGHVFTAAAAIARSLHRNRRSSFGWAYDHVPGFARIAEWFYRIIASNRTISSAVIRALWGRNVRPPEYLLARTWFLRGLGIVYLSAFASCWVQITGLVGSNGILPIAEYLNFAREQVGFDAVRALPTLCWLNNSDAFLHFLCGAGVVTSALLVVGTVPILCLFLLFVLYLSLAVAGQTFFHFQWDILLLETGFLSFFFAPTGFWLTSRREARAPRVGLFLLKVLLFKLMFMSGVVKLTSGDDSWFNLTALDYHYWSQPLPTVFAWFADKHPDWIKHASVAICLFIEIAVPFLIWAPRRLRLIAAGLLIFLQIAIAITGNYCFFNLLTVVLCLLVIDDSIWVRLRWKRLFKVDGRAPASPDTASQELRAPLFGVGRRLQFFAAIVVLIGTLPLNLWYIYSAFKPDADMPSVISSVAEKVAPFRMSSGYGLFRVMTKDRREIVVEGSNDGIDWAVYEFKWKPGDVQRMPGWNAPHQPRLDWQMWFAALSTAQHSQWFLRFAGCLLENRREVTDLLATNPFPEHGPNYIRARFYRYRFSTSGERRQTGAWWTREEVGEYLPTVSLKQ